MYADIRAKASEIMNLYAGIIRTEEGLKEGLRQIDELERAITACESHDKEYYIEASRRLLCVARLIMSPALLRKESRGGHYREDYPNADEAFAVHSVQRCGEEITTAPVNSNYFNF
jgi:L-aspartate oxidase